MPVAEDEGERKLAAILSTDAVGYSRLMEDDERATVHTLKDYREVFKDHIERHKGRVVDAPGDNLLAEFPSAIEAVTCAAEVQQELARRNSQLVESRQMHFRIGINVGDVLEENGALFGDGVNVAARLEALAEGGGICISGTAFDQVKGKVPYALDYFGKQEIKNIEDPVRAYRVAVEAGAVPNELGGGRRRPRTSAIAAVAAILLALGAGVWMVVDRTGRGESSGPSADSAGHSLDLPLASTNVRSIAVLPFVNLSGDQEQEYFSDGITEDIITELARRRFSVIARNSTFKYKERSVDVREVGQDLGAGYVVEGSVRRSGNVIKVVARLLDTNTGEQLWADTYEDALTATNIFEIQEQITGQIVTSIGHSRGAIARIDQERAQRKPPDDLSSYECVLVASAYAYDKSAERHVRARDCLEHAVARNPEYAAAWQWLAFIYTEEHGHRYNRMPGSLDRALVAARTAVNLDPASAHARWPLAVTYFHRHDLHLFFEEAEKTLSLSPNDYELRARVGRLMAYAGQWDKGIALIRQAMKLDPYTASWYHFVIGHYHLQRNEYEVALAEYEKINMPEYFSTWRALAVAYAHLGRIDEAKAAADRMFELYPEYDLDVARHLRDWNYSEDFIALTVEGLRKAGLDVPFERDAAD